MHSLFSDLRCREVINICDGTRLGYISDMDIDTCTSCITAVIVPGKAKFFGLFGREDDYVIPWQAIKKIGDDIVLIECEFQRTPKKKERLSWL